MSETTISNQHYLWSWISTLCFVQLADDVILRLVVELVSFSLGCSLPDNLKCSYFFSSWFPGEFLFRAGFCWWQDGTAAQGWYSCLKLQLFVVFFNLFLLLMVLMLSCFLMSVYPAFTKKQFNHFREAVFGYPRLRLETWRFVLVFCLSKMTCFQNFLRRLNLNGFFVCRFPMIGHLELWRRLTRTRSRSSTRMDRWVFLKFNANELVIYDYHQNRGLGSNLSPSIFRLLSGCCHAFCTALF